VSSKLQKPNRSWILPWATAALIYQVCIVGVYHRASPATKPVDMTETECPTQ